MCVVWKMEIKGQLHQMEDILRAGCRPGHSQAQMQTCESISGHSGRQEVHGHIWVLPASLILPANKDSYFVMRRV